MVAMGAKSQLALGGVTVLEAGPRHCRWPIGDPHADSFRFCGRPKSAPGPYCEDHAEVAWPSRAERRARGL